MRRIFTLTAIMLIALIVPTGIYALNLSLDPVPKGTEEIAVAYIKGAQTFLFDGMGSTLKVVSIVELESYPVQYVVTIKFSCLHSGYGERTGQMVLQVITPHTAVVKVVEGKVTEAVIDGRWDELNGRPIQQTSSDIEKIALSWLYKCPTFVFDGIPATVKVVDSWQAQTFAAPSFWQVTIEFDSRHAGYGDRAGLILAQVITHHTIRIHVTEGEVTFAVIDERWDELNQKPLPSPYTQEEATETAISWLYGCPTFRFDGVPETVRVLKVDALRMPYAWVVSIGFTCNYPGYGNRTGNVMLGKTQEHVIRVTVIEGTVTRAVIDERWDEVNQRMLNGPATDLITNESARDLVIAYLIEAYDLKASLPDVWAVEDLTPQGILGRYSARYTSNPWSIVVEYMVVLKPTYNLTVEYRGTGSFTWIGTVDQGGDISEIETNLVKPDVHYIYGPEDARDICVDYILANHQVKAKAPAEWSSRNLVPEGILGYTRMEYTGDGWRVTVSAPVVWKPTYSVEVSFTGVSSFSWRGSLPQGGPVQELEFK